MHALKVAEGGEGERGERGRGERGGGGREKERVTNDTVLKWL